MISVAYARGDSGEAACAHTRSSRGDGVSVSALPVQTAAVAGTVVRRSRCIPLPGPTRARPSVTAQ